MENSSETTPAGQTQSRRGFGYAVIYGLGAVIGAALAVPAALYLLLPTKTRKQESWVEAGDLSQLQPGTPEEMTFRRTHTDGWKIYSEKGTAWVVKKADGEVLAFAPDLHASRLRLPLGRGQGDFVCPCHASKFCPGWNRPLGSRAASAGPI